MSMTLPLVQAVMLAADKDFASAQLAVAKEIRNLSGRKAKEDAVQNLLKTIPSDKQEVFMDATMLVLKGDGTPGAAKWMENIDKRVHVTISSY